MFGKEKGENITFAFLDKEWRRFVYICEIVNTVYNVFMLLPSVECYPFLKKILVLCLILRYLIKSVSIDLCQVFSNY